MLLIIGGLILILSAVLQIAGGLRGLFDLNLQFPSLGSLTEVAIAIIVGIVAFAGAGQVSNSVLNVVLLILGFIAGGLGGILVILGALIALITKFVKI